MALKGYGGSGTGGLNALDLCFVVDATGSMSPWIDQVRAALTRVAAAVAAAPSRPNLRFALVEYRDHPQRKAFLRAGAGPSPAGSTGFVRDVDAFGALLRAVRCSGGDDGPEAVADGIEAALRLPWRQSAQKACVLIADAPPHGAGAPGDAFPAGCPCGVSVDAVIREGGKVGIVVHAVAVTNDTHAQLALRSAAAVGGGEFFTLTDTTRLGEVLADVATAETGKVLTDLEIVRRYAAAGGDIGRLARETGMSEAEIAASVDRLRAKSAITGIPDPGRPAAYDHGRASRVRIR
jgi:hypothetical protein